MSENLFTRMMVPVHMMDRRTTTGPFGPESTWTEGAAFRAAIIKDRSLQARVAEHDGVTSVYTITVPAQIDLDFHDVIKRDSDGALFRITSESADSKPPEVASFAFQQAAAERWEIPAK